MNATISMGASALNPLAHLPPARLAPTGRKPTDQPKELTFRNSPNGLIAYRHRAPIAWIVPGYHNGKLGKQPKTARFVDVAYHRQTTHGINLETFDCDTVEQAKAALSVVFGNASPAHAKAALLAIFGGAA